MRVLITLGSEVVNELDRRVGRAERSAFIARAIALALMDDRRWELIEASIGAIGERQHTWDRDPAAWVRDSRRADVARLG